MQPPTLTIEAELWPLVLDALAGGQLDGDARTRLVAADILAADGRAFAPDAARTLAGLADARAVVSVRTVRARTAADLDLFLAPGQSTAVERVADRLSLSSVATAVAPVRLAEQLGIGPRGIPSVALPVAVSSDLLPALLEGDHGRVLACVDELVGTFAARDGAVADAIEAGDWRLSLIHMARGEQTEGIVLFDTRAGLFVVGVDVDEVTLTPTTTAELWRRISGSLALAVDA